MIGNGNVLHLTGRSEIEGNQRPNPRHPELDPGSRFYRDAGEKAGPRIESGVTVMSA